ncbi:MAG: polyribonucleotide nucleotidyltransferase [Patescibacteria group bacterium]
MSNIKKWSTEWAGRELVIEAGKYASQAHAACTCRYGDTEVLATVVQSSKQREGIDYFPLMVDYEERLYAAGKIKGSRFVKREGRPSDEAILISRMIDRAIRPLFKDESRLDIQVILTVFCIDEENGPDIPAFIAASCALALSGLDWQGPISGIRIGLINNELVFNPSCSAREKSDLDLVVASTLDNKVIMIEGEAKEVKEEEILRAIEQAKKHNQKIIKLISDIQAEIGKPKIELAAVEDLEPEVFGMADKFLSKEIPKALFNHSKDSKKDRILAIAKAEEELNLHLTDQQVGKEKREKAQKLVKKYAERAISQAIIKESYRVDGRKLDEIRPLKFEVGLFPRTHGSAHFSRGETQVVSVVTLGSPGDVLHLDTMETESKQRYMHHYNFPPYSVGEVAPLRGPGRRDIGHGALAEKALRAVLPVPEEFPYTIRVVSEVLSSNGSSSMASACGSSLALMDAGVPIKSAVAGIAIGLCSDNQGNYKIITDLQDLEDGSGGMDFKICGTGAGVTAIQMDTKTNGLSDDIVRETFNQARQALNQILAEMSKVIPAPRPELSPYAPRIYTLHIDPEKIGLVIGPQGKTINKIIDETGVDIDIEKDGTVLITAVDQKSAEAAIKSVEDLTREIEVGQVYEGKVSRILNFGAMVEITPTHEGLVHVSNLSNNYVGRVEDVVKLGDSLKVKVIEKDDLGRINLTVEGVKPKPAGPRRNDRNRHNNFR